MKKNLALTILTFAFTAMAFAQGDPAQAPVTVTKVAGNVYMLVGAGGNIGLSVGEDGVVMIDDQFAPLAPKIQAAIKQVSDKPLKFIVNTHYHTDHTGGNAAFGQQAPIVAQTNVRKRLASGYTLLGDTTPPAPKVALPMITFDQSMALDINGERVRIVHFPRGHTDGDSVIFFTGSNVVHMGDHLFNNMFPLVDLDGGGSAIGMLANNEKIYAMLSSDAKLIPGHGALATKEDLKRFNTMLRESIALVRNGIRDGKTLEKLQSENVLAKYESWGKGFIKTDHFTSILYQELSAKKK